MSEEDRLAAKMLSEAVVRLAVGFSKVDRAKAMLAVHLLESELVDMEARGVDKRAIDRCRAVFRQAELEIASVSGEARMWP